MLRPAAHRSIPVPVRALLAALLLLAGAAPASGQSVAERVRARGWVACGGVARAGIAQDDGKGGWSGIDVDVCRAVAVAVLGPPGRIAFHGYASEAEFDRVRNATDDVYFLTGGEINALSLIHI